jgi:cation diffusion facilitator CzcD-associated flavoprotein CzcO
MDEQGYAGPATLAIGADRYEVQVELRGGFQPIDGRFHWYGRIAAHDGLAAALGPARMAGTLATPEGQAACEVSDPDPWQRYRVSGRSTPPFAVATDLPPEDAEQDERSEQGEDAEARQSCVTDQGHVRVAIIGTGFGGLGAAIALRRSGRRDFVLLERAGSVGGTWRDNTYPGCACDVPSHLYSFSFAPNPAWSRSFSPQPEIRRYLEDVTDRYGLRPHIRFGTEVTEARWDTSAARWRLATSRGALSADVLVSAAGPLSAPALPDVSGLDTFPGEVFHSARWNHDYDLAGQRVAVVGTGASAIQIVPAIQPAVSELTLFQRTPAWIMPRRDHRISGPEHWLYWHLPMTQRLARTALHVSREALVGAFTRRPARMRAGQRVALAHLARSVPDPDLRRALTPDYVMGCKRILLSGDFYPALDRPNVRLVTSGLAKVEGSTLIAQDGTEAEADALILATGFHAIDVPLAARIYGRDGATLARAWGEDMQALRGTSVAGFPNLCLIIGPNTGLGHNSMIHIIEAQVGYLTDYLATLDRLDAAALDARAGAQQRWCADIERRMARTVWATGGCVSWYLNAAGRNPTLWPGSIREFRRATRRVDLSEYDILQTLPARSSA